jgi:hypothetical protein
MASILFTKLSDKHFDASCAGEYSDAIEGYGIDAPEWLPRGGCRASDGPEFSCDLRADTKNYRSLLARAFSSPGLKSI